MRRPLLGAAALLALVLGGCGDKIDVKDSDPEPVKRGAELFSDRCSGCHSFDAAGAVGSKASGQVEGGERTNGPNFDQKQETTDDVLFAIRNGGFSGAIMPANIVVGEDARAVAEFVCRYGGGYDPNRECTIQDPPPLPAQEEQGEGGDGEQQGEGQQGGGEEPAP